MPWRGPEYPGEFPTLGYVVAEWIQERCAVPDRHLAGDPFVLTEKQLEHLVWEYRLHPGAKVDEDRPSAPFAYVGNYLVRPQKYGKGPFSASRVCAQAEGPVLFAGWDAYGEPVGMPWSTPHIQVTAVSEDQAQNIWRALIPMIEMGSIAADIPDRGLTRINLRSGGLIEPTTAAARSRLGQRITYVEQDEIQSWTERNGGHQLADNQRRNVAGTGGRWSATGNAYDPSENSVMQLDLEAELPSVYVDYPEPLPGSWKNKRDRRRILKHAYAGADWVDLDRIELDCQRLDAKGDPGQAERYFGNRVVFGADKAFNVEAYKQLADTDRRIDGGRLVTLGFDGALTYDATGLVATDVELGHQVVVGWWQRPANLHEDDDWEVPLDELNEAIAYAFDYWNVWRLNGDPPHYTDDLNRWAGLHGDDKVVKWWTNRTKAMGYALKAWRTDMRPGVMSHGPLNDSAEALAAHQALIQHVGNARRRPTMIRDDEDDKKFLWVISKDGQKSPRKIDLAMAAVLSWEARGMAIAAGALNEPTYGRASWR